MPVAIRNLTGAQSAPLTPLARRTPGGDTRDSFTPSKDGGRPTTATWKSWNTFSRDREGQGAHAMSVARKWDDHSLIKSLTTVCVLD